jgi:hypothetical protein
MTPDDLIRPLRAAAVFAAAIGLLALEVEADSELWHLGVFYLCTLCAFAALPWNRKADIVVGAICIAAGWEAVHGATLAVNRLEISRRGCARGGPCGRSGVGRAPARAGPAG